jgi:hypothetical protein
MQMLRASRIFGLALFAAIALGAATSASAAPPEFGRCVPAATAKTGEYKGAKCTLPAGGKGTYNWLPGPGPSPKFVATGEKVSLETVGKTKIQCAASTADGEYTGAKTETETLVLIGCIETATNQKCQTNPFKEGEIETEPLEGELGFISNGEIPVVGVDLKPKSPSTTVAVFSCGKPPETPGLSVLIEGSVIAPIKPTNNMLLEFKSPYVVTAGKQAVQQFEGGAKDTLTANIRRGTTTSSEEIGLRQIVLEENEERMEIKAK